MHLTIGLLPRLNEFPAQTHRLLPMNARLSSVHTPLNHITAVQPPQPSAIWLCNSLRPWAFQAHPFIS